MTIGERTFEEYLVSRGITDFEFEKLRDGKVRPPDYTITRDREYLFEVKDFEPTDIGHGGSYDAHSRIRQKIDAARSKFKEYEGWPCALVLYDNNAPLVDITTPEIVLGAMYGDAGIIIPFNAETGAPTGQERQAFLNGGKMIRPHWRKPENTRISALITLRYVHVGKLRLEQYVSKLKTNAANRVERAADILKKLSRAKLQFDQDEKHLGVIVWENAFAAQPFPRDLFCGDYDEIYGIVGENQQRVFAGRAILAYEELEASISKPTIFDILGRNNARRKARKRKRLVVLGAVIGAAAITIFAIRVKERK